MCRGRGKTLRGSQKQGAPGGPLLSALAHRVGVPLAHQAVDAQTTVRPVALALRPHLGRAGRIVPLDALLTQRHLAPQQVAARGA